MNMFLYTYASFARAVYHTPSESVTARSYFINSLSRSLLSTTMSAKNGVISSAFQRERVRNKSANRPAGSDGSSDEGKYVMTDVDVDEYGELEER